MMRRPIWRGSRMRKLQPVSLLVPAGSVYLLLHLAEAVVPPTWAEPDRWWRLRWATILAVALVYGGWRAGAFHPLLRSSYETWLRHSAWRWPKPLPLGPVHLVWEDVVVGALVGWCLLEPARAPVDSVWFDGRVPVLLFLLGYGAVLWLTMAVAPAIMVTCLFLLPLTVYPVLDGWVALAVLAAAVALMHVGLWRWLRRYPWNDENWNRPPAEVCRDAMRHGKFGWPLGAVGPVAQPEPMNWTTGVVWAALLAWWVHVGAALLLAMTEGVVTWDHVALSLSLSESDNLREADQIFAWCWWIAVGGVALLRLILYCQGYGPPISLRGRLLTGRWIIPGYDQVYLGPALVVALGVMLPMLLVAVGVPSPLVLTLSTFVVMLVAMKTGPSLRRWCLTGQHRIADRRRQTEQTVGQRRDKTEKRSVSEIEIELPRL